MDRLVLDRIVREMFEANVPRLILDPQAKRRARRDGRLRFHSQKFSLSMREMADICGVGTFASLVCLRVTELIQTVRHHRLYDLQFGTITLTHYPGIEIFVRGCTIEREPSFWDAQIESVSGPGERTESANHRANDYESTVGSFEPEPHPVLETTNFADGVPQFNCRCSPVPVERPKEEELTTDSLKELLGPTTHEHVVVKFTSEGGFSRN
jgi:hypothetical protein